MRGFLVRLAGDEQGNVAITFGLTATALVGFIGAAVDVSRWMHAREQVRSSMDAAVLAGTRTLIDNEGNTTLALSVAEKIYKENAKRNYQLDGDSISFIVNPSGDGIKATGTAWVKTPFLNLFNIDRIPAVKLADAEGSEARYVRSAGGSDLEVSLMLDVTGSMCDDGEGPCTSSVKLNALKTAAKRLVETVVWEDQSTSTSRVALVPFSTRVRVEPDGQGGPLMKQLTNLDPTWSGWYKMCVQGSGGGGSESGGNWSCSQYQKKYYTGWKVMPCVTNRFFSWDWRFDYTDDAPGAGAWLNAHDGTRMTIGFDSSDTSPNSDNWAKTRTGVSKSKAADHWNFAPWGGGGECADVANSNIIMPLTSDIATLNQRIDGLEAYGATAGALGTAWAWYMLSPNWSGVWTGDSTPASYGMLSEVATSGAPKLRKVAILMTDGVYNTYRGWKDQDQQYVSDAAVQLCSNMKAEGIEIYTVGFALDSLPQSERQIAISTLQSCGTDIDHFYNTLDPEALVSAFEEIASKVTKSAIRLTK